MSKSYYVFLCNCNDLTMTGSWLIPKALQSYASTPNFLKQKMVCRYCRIFKYDQSASTNNEGLIRVPMLIVLGATLGSFLWVITFFSPEHTLSFSDSNSVRNFITCEIAISPHSWQKNPSGKEEGETAVFAG